MSKETQQYDRERLLAMCTDLLDASNRHMEISRMAVTTAMSIKAFVQAEDTKGSQAMYEQLLTDDLITFHKLLKISLEETKNEKISN